MYGFAKINRLFKGIGFVPVAKNIISIKKLILTPTRLGGILG